jgi:hypothetical protein
MANELEHVGVLGMHWGHRKARPGKETVATANRILNDRHSTREARTDAMTRIGVDQRGRTIKDFNPASRKEIKAAKSFVEKYKMTPLQEKNFKERERNRKIGLAITSVYAGVLLTGIFAPGVIRTAAWVTGKTTYIGPARP